VKGGQRGKCRRTWQEKQKAGKNKGEKLIIFIIAQKFILFARAVNIFDSDFEMAKSRRTAPLPLLFGISNDFGSLRSLLNVYALLNLISLRHTGIFVSSQLQLN